MFRRILLLLSVGLIFQCDAPSDTEVLTTGPYLQVLGIAQDAGYPQAGCIKDCCQQFWAGSTPSASPSCLVLIDEQSDQFWLFEATPAIKEQLQAIYDQTGISEGSMPAGIFLTHAHIGHYTGLMQLGREVMGAQEVPVYAMPRMQEFLTENGPWAQLVTLGNIQLQPLVADSAILLMDNLEVTPFLVPHRDEYSETVGFKVAQEGRSVIFIPDIDKWNKWDRDIRTLVAQTDCAWLDGTFFEDGELPGRDMSQIPHPFIQESMALMQDMPADQRQRVHFIHFNHTNPALFDPAARGKILDAGFSIAEEGQRFLF